MNHLDVLHHDPFPAGQFEEPAQQHQAVTLGMWTFLASEVLFFGVLFICFYIYRMRWPGAFAQGAREMKWYLGAINTAVLLTSSYTMALSVHSASEGHRSWLIRWLLATAALGLLFLGIKITEYIIDYHQSLIPGLRYAEISPEGDPRPQPLHLFMTFYFVMTLLHAAHMLVGLGVMAILLLLAAQGKFDRVYHNPVELMGLYWHFVDIVWVFLFPTLYLLRH